ncbi:hypothetical protein QJS66_19135 [Kocuria rhizophila]|nr:hypothetical protein QJS66_19135 [Kocuria rhizophila]
MGIFLVGRPGEMVNSHRGHKPGCALALRGRRAMGVVSVSRVGPGLRPAHVVVHLVVRAPPRMRRPGRRMASAGCCSRCWARSAPPWWAWRTTATAPARSHRPRPSSWTCPGAVHPLVAGSVLAAVLAAMVSISSAADRLLLRPGGGPLDLAAKRHAGAGGSAAAACCSWPW